MNTNHHQAVKILATDFKAIAFAKDSVIEAYEWKNPTGKPFLIAVQWHPERLDSLNPLSYKIGEKFVEEVKQYAKKK